MLKGLFKEAVRREGFDFDYNYCWNNWNNR